jgi:hypothetical protein
MAEACSDVADGSFVVQVENRAARHTVLVGFPAC